MSSRWRTMAMVAAFAAAPALAHESAERAMGVVDAVTPERIVVKTADGHEVTFAVTKATQFLRGREPARAADVQVGERAVVRGKRSGGVVQAVQVKLAPAPPAK